MPLPSLLPWQQFTMEPPPSSPTIVRPTPRLCPDVVLGLLRPGSHLFRHCMCAFISVFVVPRTETCLQGSTIGTCCKTCFLPIDPFHTDDTGRNDTCDHPSIVLPILFIVFQLSRRFPSVFPLLRTYIAAKMHTPLGRDDEWDTLAGWASWVAAPLVLRADDRRMTSEDWRNGTLVAAWFLRHYKSIANWKKEVRSLDWHTVI